MLPNGNSLRDNIMDTLKLNIMTNKSDKGDNMMNMLMTIFFISIFTALSNYVKDGAPNLSFYISKNRFYSYFFKQNKIIIEGKRCFKSTDYITRNDNLFGHTFEAIFTYIHKNMNNNEIYSIKEYSNDICSDHYPDSDDDDDINPKTIYIINQRKEFQIEKNIFCSVQIDKENLEGGNNSKTVTQIEHIEISLYSYNISLIEIQNFVENITYKYMNSINKFRSQKLFIYNYEGQKDDEHRSRRSNRKQESNCIWSECLFSSNRKFSNIFFDEK